MEYCCFLISLFSEVWFLYPWWQMAVDMERILHVYFDLEDMTGFSGVWGCIFEFGSLVHAWQVLQTRKIFSFVPPENSHSINTNVLMAIVSVHAVTEILFWKILDLMNQTDLWLQEVSQSEQRQQHLWKAGFSNLSKLRKKLLVQFSWQLQRKCILLKQSCDKNRCLLRSDFF